METVKAILFDTFGTVVDWRGSVAGEIERLAREKGIDDIDGDAFARAWRAGYQPGMEEVRSGRRPWTSIDVVHRERLDAIVGDFGLAGLSDGERDDLNRAWHRLDPWPDSLPGLRRLHQRFILGPLSNGSTQLLINIAKRVGLPWDVIGSSDAFRSFKPQAEMYLGAVSMLDMEPGEVMMAAAHNDDLKHAQSHGMRTAFICRPYEYGVDQVKDLEATGDWDFVVDGIDELADRLLSSGGSSYSALQ